MAQAEAVILNGVEFPVKWNGYKHSRNKIWSKNTGRTNSGKMVGSILAIKEKVEVTFLPLTPAQAKIIDDVVSDIDNPFQTVKILFVDGTTKEITAYTGDISYSWVSTGIGENGVITGSTLSIIEQ